jgi:hypothetical protein
MLYLIVLIIFCALLIFVITQFFAVLFRGYAPFVSTKHELIRELGKLIEVKEDAIVYELGAGDAPLLLELSMKQKKAHYIGLENSFLPWLIGNIQIMMHKRPIKLRKKNFYRAYVGDADIIYCYLNPATMKRLETKLPTECRPGTQIISLSFPFPNLKPQKQITLHDQEVYFYSL